MGSARVLLPFALLVALVGAGAAFAVHAIQRDAGESGEYRVTAEGPEGLVLDETVRVENATVLRALEAAAAQAGLTIDVERYPGMGEYVRAIGPWRAAGASGWIYEVREEDGSWTGGDRSAGLYALRGGAHVRWRWADA